MKSKKFIIFGAAAILALTPAIAGCANTVSAFGFRSVRKNLAEPVTGTITFGSGTGSLNVNAASVSGEDDSHNTWTVKTVGTTSFTPNASYAQIGSSSKPATSITFETTLDKDYYVTSLESKFGGFNGTTGNINVSLGDTTIGTGSLNASTDVVVTNNKIEKGSVLSISITGISKGVKAYYIKFKYQEELDSSKEYYDVSFNSMGGTSVDSITDVEEGSTIANLPFPTRSKDELNQKRYAFAGWYWDVDENNPVYDPEKQFIEGITEVNGDLELFAKRDAVNYYIVSFNTMGGNTGYPQNVDENDTIQPWTPSREDYIFVNWYTTEDYANESLFDVNTPITSNITLYAKWNPIAIQEDGVFVKISSNEELVDGGKYLIVNEDATKAFNGSLTSTFDASGNCLSYAYSNEVGNNEFIALDDFEKAYFTISTSSNTLMSSDGHYIGRAENSNGLNANKNTVYTNTFDFDENGNFIVKSQGNTYLKYNSSDNRFRYYKTGQEDIQLYVFTQLHEVTYVLNNGQSNVTKKAVHGKTLSLLENPEKESDASFKYSFAGWYTDENLTNAFNINEPINSNLTLYAKYDSVAIDSPDVLLESSSSFASLHASEQNNLSEATDSVIFSEVMEASEVLNNLEIGNVIMNGDIGTHQNSVPKYFTNGSALRVYAGNTLTFENSQNIKSIDFTFDSDHLPVLTCNEGTLEDNVWSGSSNSITFNVTTAGRLTGVSIEYEKTSLSVENVGIRFGASLSKHNWDQINSKWEISDYGFMLVKKSTLSNTYKLSSISEAYAAEKTLYISRKGSGEVPYLNEETYTFTLRVNINEANYAIVYCACPFVVAGGNYYFLDQIEYSVNTLATYCLNNGGSTLSEEALNVLKGN